VSNVAERPLRLIIFTILYIFDVALSAEMGFIHEIMVRLQVIPPQFKVWLLATYASIILAWLLLLATLWARSKMGYILALIYIAVGGVINDIYSMTTYTINTPYALTFLIIESTMLALLLSLWNYFTKP
jgi:hypothetical protein